MLRLIVRSFLRKAVDIRENYPKYVAEIIIIIVIIRRRAVV
jgi:hypothetical protein